MARYKLTLEHDSYAENPSEWGGWKVYSFSPRHTNYIELHKIYTEELRSKMDVGLAFLLSYYEHSNCVWSLSGEGPTCQFDSVKHAGMVEWEGKVEDLGAKSPEDRQEDARNFLEIYTKWCNGAVYYYNLEKVNENPCPTCGKPSGDEDNKDVESCGGWYSANDISETLKMYLKEGDTVKIVGDAAWLQDKCSLAPALVVK